MPEPSPRDVEYLELLRENVRAFMREAAASITPGPALVLDVAPQDHEGARPYFPSEVTIETIDLDPEAGCTYTGDICATNASIPNERFDHVVCTEVLEHVLAPHQAVDELYRILKPGGLLLLSTPFNFRIHGPLPDCWRFTEHGLRALLQRFSRCDVRPLETPDRPLMPIHYTTIAVK